MLLISKLLTFKSESEPAYGRALNSYATLELMYDNIMVECVESLAKIQQNQNSMGTWVNKQQ